MLKFDELCLADKKLIIYLMEGFDYTLRQALNVLERYDHVWLQLQNIKRIEKRALLIHEANLGDNDLSSWAVEMESFNHRIRKQFGYLSVAQQRILEHLIENYVMDMDEAIATFEEYKPCLDEFEQWELADAKEIADVIVMHKRDGVSNKAWGNWIAVCKNKFD